MKVYLLKDVEKIGMAGEIIKTSEGYARNFLIPKKLGVEVTEKNEESFKNRLRKLEERKEVIETKTSMAAERIKDLELVLKKKMHDGDKLYAAIGANEIVDLLAKEGVSVSKSQVEFDKSIKSKGSYSVTIKLSSKLKPVFKLKVVPE